VTRNLSFDRDLAGLCGLTYMDLEDALEGIYKDPEAYNNFLSEMTKKFLMDIISARMKLFTTRRRA
jgi:hypothetical protein